jgi:glycosyltransferase involved in cell wall biosynthesis
VIRVLRVIDSLRGGGAERLLEQTLPELPNYGAQAQVLYLNAEEECLPGLQAGGVACTRLYNDPGQRFRAIFKSPGQRREDLRRAEAAVDRFRPDVLHACLTGSYIFTRELARRTRLPYLVTDHLVEDPWQVQPGLKATITRKFVIRAYRDAAFVVCCGPAIRHQLETVMSLRDLRYEVVENCVKPEFFRDAPIFQPGAFHIASVGRLAPQKNLDTGLRALARLLPARPGVTWGIAGDGAERERLQQQAAELGIAEKVTFLGRVSSAEVRALLDSSKVFFMPSRKEGLPLAAVEGLARGAPGVLSTIPSFTLTFPGESGIDFVDPGDVDGMAAALGRALDGPDRFPRPHFEARFGVARHNRQLVELYERAMASRTSDFQR